MPLLGLFHRKDKHKSPPSSGTPAGSVSPSPIDEQDSAEQDYILAKQSVPASPSTVYSANDDAASSKRKLFRRKHSKPIPAPHPSQLSPPRPTQSTQSSYNSQADQDLLRPPSRNLFATYGDPHSALSTRSLPEAPTLRPNPRAPPTLQETYSNPDLRPSTSSLQTPEPRKRKKSGVLSWAQRERTKSKPSPPELPPVPPVESFNLKSFRHVRPDSPSNPPPEQPDRPGSAMSGHMTPPPRSRGNSVTNDPTQRVSVALFREAQARKQTAGTSPITPSRPPSRLDGPPPIPMQARVETEPTKAPPHRRPPSRSATMPVHGSQDSSDSSTDSSDSSSDSSDSDSVDQSTVRPLRNGASTPRTPQKASSEMGHLTQPTHNPSKSDSAHQMFEHSSPLRRRASRSMSAAAPNADANRASAIASMATNLPNRPAFHARAPARDNDSTSDESSDSSSEDSDNAPLARLVVANKSTASLRTKVPQPPPKQDTMTSTSSATSPSTLELPSPIPSTILAHPPPRRSSLDAGVTLAPEIQSANDALSPSNLSERLARLTRGLSPGSSSTSPVARQSTTSPANRRKTSTESRTSATFTDGPLTTSPTITGKPEPPIVPVPVGTRVPDSSFSVTSRPKSESVLSEAGSTASQETFPAPRGSKDISTTTRSARSLATGRPATLVSMIPESTSALEDKKVPQPAARAHIASLVGNARPGTLLSQIPTSPEAPEARQNLRPPLSETARPGTLASLIPPSGSMSDTLPTPVTSKLRGYSPASSTTGDSSRGPHTPKDGSDYGGPFGRDRKDSYGIRSAASGGTSTSQSGSSVSSLSHGPKRGKHGRRVSIADPTEIERSLGHERGRSGSGGTITAQGEENRRRERRRSEAKAAIELGNVVNGRTSLPRDDAYDEDEDEPLQKSVPPAPPVMNPMMTGMGFPAGFAPSPAGVGWGALPWNGQAPAMPPMPQAMNAQQFMVPQPPPNADPAFLAAHQHAMAIAKQAYQYAVAQQAMAAAADEWERQTNTGGSVYGGGGGSVYGGSQYTGSSANLAGFGGGVWPGMGMGAAMYSSSRSVYDGASVYGGSDAGAWGSRSVYGESFGPSMPDPRASLYSTRQDGAPRRPPGMPKSNSSLAVPGTQSQARPSRARTKSSPAQPPEPAFARPQRDGSPRSLGRTSKAPPPSSWTARYQTALQD